MPAEGGPATQITRGDVDSRAAEWSPDGRALAYLVRPLTPEQETRIVTRNADGSWGQPRTLVKGGWMGSWSPDGRWVVSRSHGLQIVPPGGGPGRTVLPVNPATDPLPQYYDFSADGRFIYFLGQDPVNQSYGIWGVPSAGGSARILVRFDDPVLPWHRNGFRVHKNRFYFTVGDEQSDIWMTELAVSRR